MLKNQIRYATPVQDNPFSIRLLTESGNARIQSVPMHRMQLPWRENRHIPKPSEIIDRGLTDMTLQEIEGTLIQGISTIANRDSSEFTPDMPFHETRHRFTRFR